MRITEIEINNFRAFYGHHHVKLDKDGKNLMLYGENGSGKSSLFSSLQQFFKASVCKVTVEENIFIPENQKDSAFIRLSLKEGPESSKITSFELNIVQGEIVSDDKILIADANKIKGFFDYRSLLKTHLDHEKEKKKEEVNLFYHLVENILPQAENRFTNNEIGKDWEEIVYEVYDLRQGHHVVESITKNLANFNNGLKHLLETIKVDTNTFLKYFDPNIAVDFEFSDVVYGGRRDLSNMEVLLKITFFTKAIPKHQYFLNEARLSALAICLYLASIRANPSGGALKLLVLDDLLIGLDMSNRLPLLEILKNFFVEVEKEKSFQIVMTTYDKVWFELVKNYFGQETWKYVEVYSRKLSENDFEVPIIIDSDGYLAKANKYLIEKDYKASAVYLRSEFERIVKRICEKRDLSVLYRKSQKELQSDDFWNAIISQTNIDADLVKDITIHRGLVMNPFSHDNLDNPEFEKEIQNTIVAITKLNAIVPKELRKLTHGDLAKLNAKLSVELSEKDSLIKKLILAEIVGLLLTHTK